MVGPSSVVQYKDARIVRPEKDRNPAHFSGKHRSESKSNAVSSYEHADQGRRRPVGNAVLEPHMGQGPWEKGCACYILAFLFIDEWSWPSSLAYVRSRPVPFLENFGLKFQ